ncbi:MAG: hypothetical protein WAQ27_00085 [Candidatus Microsaccharimonas sp.]
MINNDIDSEYINSRYITSVQKTYALSQHRRTVTHVADSLLPIRSTQVRHALRLDTHPKTSGGVFWIDLVNRLAQNSGMSSGYEAGLVVPLATYAKEGGFDPSSITYETLPLHGRNYSVAAVIKDTALKTSPRRYLEKFPQHGYSIWNNETFGSGDDCRVDAEYANRDATQAELDASVTSSMDMARNYILTIGERVALQALAKVGRDMPSKDKVSFFEKELYYQISSKLRLAKKALATTVGSPVNISYLPTNADVRDMVMDRAHLAHSLEYL